MEGLIGFVRRNFLVPIPRVRDWNELHELLLARCLQYGAHRLEGREDRRTVEEHPCLSATGQRRSNLIPYVS